MTPLVSVLVFIFAVGAIGGIEQVNQGIHRPARIESNSEATERSERDQWDETCREEEPNATADEIEDCINFGLEYGDI